MTTNYPECNLNKIKEIKWDVQEFLNEVEAEY